VVALHRTLNAATWCVLQSYGAEVECKPCRKIAYEARGALGTH